MDGMWVLRVECSGEMCSEETSVTERSSCKHGLAVGNECCCCSVHCPRLACETPHTAESLHPTRTYYDTRLERSAIHVGHLFAWA